MPTPFNTANPQIQSEELYDNFRKAIHTPLLLWIFGVCSVLFAAGMVYLELRYPVWSHIYFARDKEDAGERNGDAIGGTGEGKEGGGLV